MPSEVKLISKTVPIPGQLPDGLDTAEGLMAYCARVSSPRQDNPEYDKLLRYCADHEHWSVFEMADMTVEIVTSRAIAQQILRHRSFSFQEFSQRYSSVSTGYSPCIPRRQDLNNRQGSIDNLPIEDKLWFTTVQTELWSDAIEAYEEALQRGVAKECARLLLPLSTNTRMYMKGSIRSWIHYCNVRCDVGTQKEHRDIAILIRDILRTEFPNVAKALR